ncbi:MAG: sulfatase-like hydrolase/transferase [Alistipes sp.]|nr:sulfatase-like hydrolase/transferase [Alistipes sp.]
MRPLYPVPCLALMSAGAAVAQDRPNVVIILVDDLGWGDVGFHGSEIPTPNIDRLAREGIEMDRFYTAPVSSPTRAGLMTGRYPHRFGIRETVLPPWREYGLDHTEMTMADLLESCGYENRAILGKWHLGHSEAKYYPLNRGFNYFYGCLNGAIDYFTHEREGELDWHRNWDSAWDEGYATDLLTREAVSYIERSKSSPFFLYLAYNAPHSPYQAPRDEIAKFIDLDTFDALKPGQQREYIYKAMITRMDTGVGEVYRALADNGLLDNTFLLFMSDNGGVPGLTGSTNRPLRGTKFEEWDGGVRVPAVIYWSKSPLQGTMCRQLSGFVDVLPTIAHIVGAGGPPRPYDGISILPVLTGTESFIDRSLYLGCGALVNTGYKFVEAGRNERLGLKEDFLVDYSADPYETTNAIDRHPETARRMKEYIVPYDTITPAFQEIPYGVGQKDFMAPKEWKITR